MSVPVNQPVTLGAVPPTTNASGKSSKPSPSSNVASDASDIDLTDLSGVVPVEVQENFAPSFTTMFVTFANVAVPSTESMPLLTVSEPVIVESPEAIVHLEVSCFGA